MDAGTRRLSRRRPVDVVVVGGGPGGTATATRLARAGRTVVLAERSGYEQRPHGRDPAAGRQPRVARSSTSRPPSWRCSRCPPTSRPARGVTAPSWHAPHLYDPVRSRVARRPRPVRRRCSRTTPPRQAPPSCDTLACCTVRARRRRGADGHHRTSGRPRSWCPTEQVVDATGRAATDRQVPRCHQSSARSPGRRVGRRRARRRSDHRRHVRRGDARRMVVRLSTAWPPAHHLDLHRLGDRPHGSPHHPIRLVGGVAAHGARRAPRPSDGADRATDGRVRRQPGPDPGCRRRLGRRRRRRVGRRSPVLLRRGDRARFRAFGHRRAHGRTVGTPCRHRRLRHMDRRAS